MPSNIIVGDRYRIRETDAGLLRITDTQEGHDYIEIDPSGLVARIRGTSGAAIEFIDAERDAVAYRYTAAGVSGDSLHDFRGLPVAGIEEYDGATLSDLADGELAFDTSGSPTSGDAFAYKERDGSQVHFFTPDRSI